ncbi:MAG: hypothetical protein AB7I32_19925 [Gammaproteobacteria bacterium]
MSVVRSLLLSTLLTGAVSAEAAVVGPTLLATLSFDEVHTLSSSQQPSTALDIKFSYSLTPGGLTDPATLIFDGRLFTPADAGSTFVLTSALDDPQLPAFLARVTNGVDDDLRDDAIGNGGGGIGLVGPESVRLVPVVAVTGPDLQGYAVSSLELHIAELFIEPNAGTSLPHWRVSGELRFIGEPTPVPLPGAFVLFASALACGWRSRRGPRAS